MAVSSRIQYTFTLFFVASLAVFDISMKNVEVNAIGDVQQHLTRRAVWSSATCVVTGAIVSHLNRGSLHILAAKGKTNSFFILLRRLSSSSFLPSTVTGNGFDCGDQNPQPETM
nr:gibberellin-regulated protein 5-like [Ipomoea batatas]